MADPGDRGPWEWRTLGMGDPNRRPRLTEVRATFFYTAPCQIVATEMIVPKICQASPKHLAYTNPNLNPSF